MVRVNSYSIIIGPVSPSRTALQICLKQYHLIQKISYNLLQSAIRIFHLRGKSLDLNREIDKIIYYRL